MPDLFDEMFKSAVVLPFTPHLIPVQMLEMGVFGASYFAYAKEADLEWLGDAVYKLALQNMAPKYRAKLNRFGVRSGDSKEAWDAQGWLKPEDPLGWFHWYCRYHNGRRHQRDSWQIQRWQRFGIRWGLVGRNQIRAKGFCSDVIKQGLLHWAYEPEVVLA